jgi:hypothetical protein
MIGFASLRRKMMPQFTVMLFANPKNCAYLKSRILIGIVVASGQLWRSVAAGHQRGGVNGVILLTYCKRPAADRISMYVVYSD